jgi:hypothetical protein
MDNSRGTNNAAEPTHSLIVSKDYSTQYHQAAQFDQANHSAQGFNSRQEQAYVSETADEEYDSNQQCDYAAPTPDTVLTPSSFPKRRQEEYDNSNYGHSTSSRFYQFAQNAPETSPFSREHRLAQAYALPRPLQVQNALSSQEHRLAQAYALPRPLQMQNAPSSQEDRRARASALPLSTTMQNADRRAQAYALPLPTNTQELQSGHQSSMYRGLVHQQANAQSRSDSQPTSIHGLIPPWPDMTTRGAYGRDYSDHTPRGPGRGDGRGRGRGRGSY